VEQLNRVGRQAAKYEQKKIQFELFTPMFLDRLMSKRSENQVMLNVVR
jgi:hypothetical protein